jgi:hypothetical protein
VRDGDTPAPLPADFMDRRDRSRSEQSTVDRHAQAIAYSWHRHPTVAAHLWYRGVNLGEMVEYSVIPRLVAAFLEAGRLPTPDEEQP